MKDISNKLFPKEEQYESIKDFSNSVGVGFN